MRTTSAIAALVGVATATVGASAYLRTTADSVQSWGDFTSFKTPQNNDNQCYGQQQSGWSWGDLQTGGFSSYDGFDFSGFSCSNSFSKRDGLLRRDFQAKCIQGSMSAGNGPSFNCGSGKDFSATQYQISVSRDTDVEMHYTMPDGTTCKQTASCKTGGTVVQNTQCGGAKQVKFCLPQGSKDSCDLGIHQVGFDCNGPPPSSSKPPSSSSAPPSPPSSSKPAPPPSSSSPVSPPSSSKPVAPPSSSKPVSPPSSSAPAPPSSSAPVPPSSSTPVSPNTSSRPQAPSSSSPPKPPTSCAGASGPYGVDCSAPPPASSSSSVPSPPASSSCAGGYGVDGKCSGSPPPPASSSSNVVPPPASSSCAGGYGMDGKCSGPVPPPASSSSFVPPPPSSSCAGGYGMDGKCSGPPPVSSQPPQPVSSSQPAPPSSQPPAPPSSSAPVGPPVSSQPSSPPSSSAPQQPPSSSRPMGPPSSSSTPASPISSSPASPPGGANCPDVLPQCLNTWIQQSGCQDNSDFNCYCKNSDFTKNVIQCVTSYGADNGVIGQALSYLQGICAAYIPQNPGLITDCPKDVPITVPAAVSTMPTTFAPSDTTTITTKTVMVTESTCTPGQVVTDQGKPSTLTSSKISTITITATNTITTCAKCQGGYGGGGGAPQYSTVVIADTYTVPCTYTEGVSRGFPIPSSSTITQLTATVTVPVVHFTTIPAAPGQQAQAQVGLGNGAPQGGSAGTAAPGGGYGGGGISSTLKPATSKTATGGPLQQTVNAAPGLSGSKVLGVLAGGAMVVLAL